jgi:hypothetical protein
MGLIKAALIAWKHTVISAMKIAVKPASKNTHHSIGMW